MGSQSKLMGDDYVKRKALPRTPSIDWFKENYELIIKSLIDNTNAKIYLITIPWIGESENEEIIEIIEILHNSSFVAKKAKKVIGIESVKEAVISAKG